MTPMATRTTPESDSRRLARSASTASTTKKVTSAAATKKYASGNPPYTQKATDNASRTT